MLKRLSLLFSLLFILALGIAKEPIDAPQLQSAFMRVELAFDEPLPSPYWQSIRWAPKSSPRTPCAHRASPTSSMKCGVPVEGSNTGPWERPRIRRRHQPLSCRPSRSISTPPHFSASPPPPVALNFNSNVTHATLLGLINEDGSVRLPGSTAPARAKGQSASPPTPRCGVALSLGYHARRCLRGGEERRTIS